METSYLMASDVARLLEVSSDTVRNFDRRGQLRAIKTAKGYRLFLREDVLRFKRRREKAKRLLAESPSAA